MPDNSAVLLLGSNISPRENLQKSIALIKEKVKILQVSSVVKTKAVGSDGPDFLNAALRIATHFSKDILKTEVLGEIETQLGRIRKKDKYAPRTIDIDLVIFNHKILDENFWKCLFIALPASELEPDIIHPKYGIPSSEMVKKMTNSTNVELVKDFKLEI